MNTKRDLRATGANYALHIRRIPDDGKTLCGRGYSTVNCVGNSAAPDEAEVAICVACRKQRSRKEATR
jgi:hypothetical protein